MINPKLLGFLAMLGVVLIYSILIVTTRYAMLSGLTPYDLTAIRYITASIILLPFFLKLGLKDLGGLGWRKAAILSLLSGSSYMMVFFTGVSLVPSSHVSVFNSGIVPSVVFWGMVILGLQQFSARKMFSLLLIIPGLILVSSSSVTKGGSYLLGDFLIFLTGISWGTFTLLCKHWQVRSMQAASIVAIFSTLFLPFYFVFFYQGFDTVPMREIIMHAVFQGVFNSIVAISLFTYALKQLDTQHVALFYPLIPILTTLFAIPLLGEYPSIMQCVGIFIVVLSMYFVVTNKQKNPPVIPRV